MSRVCAISCKECWREPDGTWVSTGGFPAQMRAIASLFDEMDLLIVEVKPQQGGMPLPRNARVTVMPFPQGSGLRRKLFVLRNLVRYVKIIAAHMRKADAVHVPLPGDLPLVALNVALFLRKRVIARYGGSWNSTSITTATNRLTRFLMRCAAGGRNVMLATGDGEQSAGSGVEWIFTTAMRREEVDSIQPVVDRGLSEPPRLLYVGRLSPEKGVGNLLRALADIRTSGFTPCPVLSIAGDGPQRQLLENLCQELGITDIVHFAGQVPRGELSRYFHAADFCVQPSLTEGLSKAWLEAMAHGIPVLATRVGAAAAVIGERGERGWLTTPGDPDALRKAMLAVITADTDWGALRRRCRAYAETRTLEAWSATIARICEQQWNCSVVEGRLAL